MEDLKFDKKDLDMILDCLNDLKYESCKGVCDNPYYDTPRTIASDIHSLIFKYDCKRDRYIELYMAINPNQKDYFHCPKCKRILNASLDWKFKNKNIMGIPMFDSKDKETVFYCKDCGWTGEEAPFGEAKSGGNQEE